MLVTFDQVSAAGWKLIRVGPEVGDLGNQAIVAEFKEAQTGLRALLPGELDPTGGVQALPDDPVHRDVPVIGEARLCLLSWGACDNPVVRCPVVVGRDGE